MKRKRSKRNVKRKISKGLEILENSLSLEISFAQESQKAAISMTTRRALRNAYVRYRQLRLRSETSPNHARVSFVTYRQLIYE